MMIKWHKEDIKSRIVADKKVKETIRAKLAQSIDPLDPTQHPKNLVNIVTVTLHLKVSMLTIRSIRFISDKRV